MAIQQQNAFEWCSSQVGKTMDVLIDEPFDAEKNVWVGRSYADAPDVDSSVFVTGQAGASISEGDLIPVEIVAFKDYDLVGVPVHGVN